MPLIFDFIKKTQSFFLLLTVFLLPFSLIPLTSTFSYFSSLNLLLLSFTAFSLFFLYVIHLLVSKKFSWNYRSFDKEIIFLPLTAFLSTLVSSGNKVQAILNPHFGLIALASITVLYFYLSRHHHRFGTIDCEKAIFTSSFIAALIIIILSVESSTESRIASLELLILFTFIFLYGLGKTIQTLFDRKLRSSPVLIFNILLLIVEGIAIPLVVYALIKQNILFPSLSYSFNASLQIFRSFRTSIFGFGIDNFSTAFYLVRDINYNQSNFWESSLNSGRSAVLHIIVESGLLGLSVISLLLFSIIKRIYISKDSFIKNIPVLLGFSFLLLALFVLPPFPIIFFLLIFVISKLHFSDKKRTVFNFSFPYSTPSFISFGGLILFVVIAFNFITDYFLAEYSYAKSLVAFEKKNERGVYENQRASIFYSPYIEQYHLTFSQTNSTISKYLIYTIASGSANTQSSDIQKEASPSSQVFSDLEKERISKPFQIALREAQYALNLNPEKAEYWANFAQVFQGIPKTIYKDAVEAVIGLNNKALALDPKNPAFNLRIGLALLDQKKPDEAITYFDKAISLKPNYADAHFTKTSIFIDKYDYSNALKEAEITQSLLDPQKNKKEYEIIIKILERLKSLTSPESQNPPSLSITNQKSATNQGNIQPPSNMNLNNPR